MIKTNQFSPKTQYVTPSCKSAELHARESILTESKYGDEGEAGGQGGWKEDDGEDY